MSQVEKPTSARDPKAFLPRGGEMGERIRALDWSSTPLGPVETWPQSLRLAVRIVLDSRYAMWLGWGPDFTFFYNDAYAKMTLGPKHPWALGRPAREVWSEIWSDIGPRAESVVRTGEATWDEGLMLVLQRRGFPEETYHTFSYSPLPDDAGGIGGMLCVVTEDTGRTIGERRLRTLRALAERTAEARTARGACGAAAETLSHAYSDLPFVAIYLLEDGRAVLAGLAGLEPGHPACPVAVALDSADAVWALARVAETGLPEDVRGLQGKFGRLPGGAWPESPDRAVVLPMSRPGQSRPAGFVVAGISPMLELSDDYRGFLSLLAGHVAAAVANARAYEEERRRVEELAEMDRAKTAFFSNVSHEFRTPLTLILGPLEDALADAGLSETQRSHLEVARRNGLRLQRLVNSLLDFSRIEAGRVLASCEPTDLAALTADLASNFRSACEKAGLELTVDCPPLGEPAFVDRSMWEKVVLNLVSNAFKFTFVGGIRVSCRRAGGAAVVEVADTGTGIPAREMPRLFERFHRVESARGRTHEGSGIGLALVHELVRLHGGGISAESEPGVGTTFIVSVPLGSAHLPPERISAGRTAGAGSAGAGVEAFVEEAARWLPEDVGEPGVSVSVPTPAVPEGARPLVLLADDNADMRQYVARLLAGQYRVETAGDGEAALASAKARRPDLVLSDVMMPRLDGFGLLRELRADPATRDVPIVLLSARSGEESRVEGMQAGADDYLVKPFAAKELLARVSAHLGLARVRREAGESLRASEARLHMALTAARMVAWEWTTADGRLHLSDNAAEIFGLPPGGALTDIAEGVALIHPDDAAGYQRTWRAAVEGCSSYLVHYRVVRPADGAIVWMEERGHCVADGPVGSARLFGVASDISERKRAEVERERLMGELREHDRRKDEFLATLAHELRNPLAPIRNGLQIIGMSGATGTVEKARAVMDRQLTQLVRLVDDLMDVSRITRGKLELRREPIDLRSAVESAVESVRPTIDRAGHTLTVSMPAEPVPVEGDSARLAQVVSNLLTNSAKYTHPGGRIRLSVGREPGSATVSVADDGIGIPPEMLSRVFEMFTQVDRTLEKTTGGLGIGLSLVRGLASAHGGSVEARSAGEGLGSEFVVRLPTSSALEGRVPTGCSVASVAPPPPRLRILVVDDNVDAAESLGQLLELHGHEVRLAHDGEAGVSAAAGFRPALILMDIGMPKLNGYEAAKRIRSLEWSGPTMLVALTGWGQDADRERSSAAGFDAHLVKPASAASLAGLLAELAARSG